MTLKDYSIAISRSSQSIQTSLQREIYVRRVPICQTSNLHRSIRKLPADVLIDVAKCHREECHLEPGAICIRTLLSELQALSGARIESTRASTRGETSIEIKRSPPCTGIHGRKRSPRSLVPNVMAPNKKIKSVTAFRVTIV